MQYLKEKILAVDPKLVATVVATVLTYVVADLLNLGLEDPVIGAGALNITYAQVIAVVAGAAAGYWKSNIATILRTPQEDGNPDPSLLK